MYAARPPVVVVGVSGKQPTAIRYAVAEAERHGTALRVIHCYSLPAGSQNFNVGAEYLGSVRESADRALADARAVVEAEAPSQDVTYVSIKGEPHAVLLVEASDAKSVVVGTDNVPWFERMLGGAVAGRVASRANCPVVVVPESAAAVSKHGAVVVTVDGDTSAAGPLSYGFEQAQARGSILMVLHAVPLGTAQADFDNHRANIAEVIAGWGKLFPEVSVLVSSTIGDPVDTSIAATAAASLVVIGRPHGRDRSFALARPVALKVLHKAQCPVAIVPSDYRWDRVSDSTRVGRQSSSV